MHPPTGSVLPDRDVGLASLVLPGLGHLLQGLPFRALLWFGGAVLLWGTLLAFASSAPASEPLWLVMAPLIASYHCASMYTAVRAQLSRSSDTLPQQVASQLLPAPLWKQAIGGAVAVAGVVVVLLWTGKFVDTLWRQANFGWGWQHWGVGELLSHTLLLWGMTAMGGWLFWQGYQEQKAQERLQREQALLAQALQNNGVITPAAASLTLHCSLREAQEYLEQLVQQGLARREDRNGLLYYRFSEE